MNKRTYIYGAAGAIIVVAIVIGAIVMLNKDEPSKTTDTNQSAIGSTSPDVTPVTSKDIKTPTNNDQLADTLTDDAAAIDTDVKNYENDDYRAATLSDSSLQD